MSKNLIIKFILFTSPILIVNKFVFSGQMVGENIQDVKQKIKTSQKVNYDKITIPEANIVINKVRYKQKEDIKVEITNNKRIILEIKLKIEKYNFKREKWREIEIGTFEIEKEYQNLVKNYGPAVFIKIPQNEKIMLKWIPITHEPLIEDKIFKVVSSGKHRIKAIFEVDGKKETIYSDCFWIEE